MICLFSSSLAYSILASVFSAQTANEVCCFYSLQNGKRVACFSFAELLAELLHTCFFKREHSASRLNSHISDLSFPQIGHLFFRAKLRYRGRLGVGNPIRNCIWKYVKNGFPAPKRDMCSDQPKK